MIDEIRIIALVTENVEIIVDSAAFTLDDEELLELVV